MSVRVVKRFVMVFGVGWIAGVACAQGPWPATLIDNQLRSRSVSLVGLDGREVEYVDDSGRTRRAPIGSLIALLPVMNTGAASIGEAGIGGADEGVVELVDGQRLPGRLVPTAGGGEVIVWEHSSFGEITIALEDIAVMARTRSAHEALGTGERVEDELLLVNGDRLSGFVIELGEPVEIETESGVVRVEHDRVAGAALSNPSKPLTGMIVWLADGTVAQVDSALTESSGVISLSLTGGQSARYEMRWVDGLAFEAGGIVALSSLEPIEQRGLDERLYAWGIEREARVVRTDIALRAGDIVLPGPMEVVYELPEGTTRISGGARLPAGIGRWGDCEVVLAVDGLEVWRERLHSGASSAVFNIEARGETLTIRVEEGRYGPVWDRVTIERAMIAVER